MRNHSKKSEPAIKKCFVATLLALCVTVLSFKSVALAYESNASNWFKTKEASVRLVAATNKMGKHSKIQLGLQFKLKKHWKIYWRSPGDAGLPPHINWKDSINLVDAKLQWPAPTRFSFSGIQTAGYENEVIFPINVTPKSLTQPLHLRAQLNFLTCNDICIPYETNLSLDLEPGIGAGSKYYRLISKYISKIPKNAPALGISIKTVDMTSNQITGHNNVKNRILRVIANSITPLKNPDIFVEGKNIFPLTKPTFTLENSNRNIEFIVHLSKEPETLSDKQDLQITITDGNRAITQNFPATTISQVADIQIHPTLSLSFILLVAVFGGLLLNFMPCVLPVIALKIMGFLSHGGIQKKYIRAAYTATSLGILFSFTAIASFVTLLKLTGAAVGWGIQFQYPLFVVALIVVVSLFSYNLWGLFELNLPSRINSVVAKISGRPPEEGGVYKHFLSGAFATILATPCSAPFLGTAVSFALAGSISEIFMVFFALGIGMSLPFLLFAIIPGLANKMPKPGNWMTKVKVLLGLALAATSFWLVTVLGAQTSTGLATIVFVFVIIIGMLLLLKRYLSRDWHFIANVGVFIAICASFVGPSLYQYPDTTQQQSNFRNNWMSLEPKQIPSLVAQGKTVFVDITAKWCVTCQINKLTVLEHSQVKELLSKNNSVIGMRGDWTQPDARIMSYLKSYSRYGIPFNIVYGPNAHQGIILPEILTSRGVLTALKKASEQKL